MEEIKLKDSAPEMDQDISEEEIKEAFRSVEDNADETAGKFETESLPEILPIAGEAEEKTADIQAALKEAENTAEARPAAEEAVSAEDESAVKAAAKPAGAQPAAKAAAKPAGAQPAAKAAAKPAGAQPAARAAAKPAGAQPAAKAAAKPAGAQPAAKAAAKPAGAQPAAKAGNKTAGGSTQNLPELKADISFDDLENKITASTVVSSASPVKKEKDENDRFAYFDEDYEEDDRPRKKKKSSRKGGLILLAVIAALIAAAYIFCGIYFGSHFYPGTVINGREVSGMTAQEVKDQIQTSIDTYVLTITERDDKKETLTAAQVGLTYNDDKKIDSLMEDQDSWKFFLHIFGDKNYEMSAGTSYDKDQATSAVDQLECMTENIVSPKDAVLVENEDGAYIEREEEGNEVDRNLLLEAVFSALDQEEENLNITDPDCYRHPSVTSDDAVLVARMNDWNALLGLSITYTFGDNVETIDKTVLLPYMSDDGSKVSVDTGWVSELVYGWGEKYNTFGRERQFTTHNGTVVTLPASTLHTGEVDASGNELEHTSDYGYLLDNEATTADLISAIDSRTSGDRTPVFRYSGMGWDNNGITGTYLEISLSEQHLWLYKDYNLVLDCQIVTGTPGADTQTYSGCFALDAQQTPATLSDVEKKGESVDVNWWMPFDVSRGLYDASWRTTFGGSEYQTNGTLGGIAVPASSMETIFETLEIGNAICIY